MGRDGSGVKPASETSIEITFTYQNVRCRERLPLQPTASNLKKAALHRAAILDAIAHGTFDYSITFPNSPRAKQFKPEVPNDTVGDYLMLWLERKKTQLKTSTYVNYVKIVNYQLMPEFGAIKLAEFHRNDVRDWLQKKQVSNKTLRNLQSVIREAMESAATEDELIPINPLAGWVYQIKEKVKVNDDVDPFSAEEQAAILNVLSSQGRNLIQFAFWTGLRTSELCALDWRDIDWFKGEIYITKALTQASDEPEVPKTTSSRRTIKLLKPAKDALLDQKQYTYGRGQEVFQNPRTEERWTGDQAIRKTLWKPALKAAEVRYRYPYQTRHTYASMMLSAGEHPMWVAQQMGHKDWGMIRKTYGRWLPPEHIEAGSKAEQLFNQTKE